jgi:hypothetical protein
MASGIGGGVLVETRQVVRRATSSAGEGGPDFVGGSTEGLDK